MTSLAKRETLESEGVEGQPSRWRRWVVPGLGTLLLGTLLVEALYLTVPKGDAGAAPVDVLIVLGTPVGQYGELTPMQRWRTDAAVAEWRAGEAPRLLFSGGPTFRGIAEADVMAAYARQQGVPAGAILEERHSFTTLQNLRNSAAIVRAHGWTRVEVVSSPEHLRRAAVLLAKTGLVWRTHAAATPGRSRSEVVYGYVEETVGTAVLRVFGARAEPVLHALSITQHRTAWAIRWLVYRLER